MLKAMEGSKVKINYIAWIENGRVFDTSKQSNALEFTVGAKEVIKGLEDAVIGMSIGDKRSISIAPNNGYGPHRDELIFEIKKSKIPKDIELKVGKRIGTKKEIDETNVKMIILEITDDYVTLDANHPLAGKVLKFDIELIEVETILN